jgi:hypothetical protein
VADNEKAFGRMDDFGRLIDRMAEAGRVPADLHTALVNVADLLEMAVMIARTRLGDRWTGADALEICRLVSEERERLVRREDKKPRSE